MTEWIERSPRSREVAGSSPDRAKPNALKQVQVVGFLGGRSTLRGYNQDWLALCEEYVTGCTHVLCLRHGASVLDST